MTFGQNTYPEGDMIERNFQVTFYLGVDMILKSGYYRTWCIIPEEWAEEWVSYLKSGLKSGYHI
jgi:hypothetical protein